MKTAEFQTEANEDYPAYDYRLGMVDVDVALNLSAKVANMLAESVKHLPPSLKPEDIESFDIGAFLSPLIGNPDLGPRLIELGKAFADRCQVAWIDEEGNAKSQTLSKVWNVHWQGRYDDYLRWLIFATRFNLGSFLRGVQGLGALFAKGRSSSKSQSPVEKTGQSGA